MAGVALQSAGLYLCLVVVPLFASGPMARGVRRLVLSSVVLLALCYLVPIIIQSLLSVSANPLRFCVIDPPRVKSCDLTIQAWFKSPASGAFFGLSLGWGILALRRTAESPILTAETRQLPLVSDDSARFKMFGLGLLWATIVFFAYGLLQHMTGYNLLSVEKILAEEHRMANGRYRIFGFYGHPLSLAGAALVWLSLALWGLRHTWLKSSSFAGLNLSAWALIAVLQSLNVLMSGGRTALVVAALFWGLLVAWFAWHLLRHKLLSTWFERQPRLAVLSLVLVFVGVIAVAGLGLRTLAPDLNPRGVGGGTLGQGPLGDRPFFWQTYLAMWRESPWLGQGYFAVEHGLRTEFYFREGLAELRDKFNAHNIYLEVLGISGLIGLFAYLIILVLLFLNLKFLAGSSDERRGILYALLIALFANLLHGLTQNTFFDSAVTACYLGLIGLLVVPPFKSKLASKP